MNKTTTLSEEQQIASVPTSEESILKINCNLTKFENLLLKSCAGSIAQICNQNRHLHQGGLSSYEGFYYILFVLLFYSVVMFILILKYHRREAKEMELSTFYSEYVSRETFSELNRQKQATCKFKEFIKRHPDIPVSLVYNERLYLQNCAEQMVSELESV